MRLFRGKSLQEIRDITFEIGMQEQYGLDIKRPQGDTRSAGCSPGRTFSALELLCIMYAGFKLFEPGMDIGIYLGEEWGMAERLGKVGCGLINHYNTQGPYASEFLNSII
jgi:hypothetical protein